MASYSQRQPATLETRHDGRRGGAGATARFAHAQATAVCNIDKRERLGDVEFKKQRAAARQAQRAAQRAWKGAAAAAACNKDMDVDVDDVDCGGEDTDDVRLPAAFDVPPAAAVPIIDIAGQLERVAELRSKGILDDDEFRAAKAKILALSSPQPDASPPSPTDASVPLALRWHHHHHRSHNSSYNSSRRRHARLLRRHCDR